jgi:hypothetical protein
MRFFNQMKFFKCILIYYSLISEELVGQGVIEADNGMSSILDSKKISFLPKEIPDLIKNLIQTAEFKPEQAQNAPSMIKKRNYDNYLIASDIDIRKRESDQNEVNTALDQSKRTFGTLEKEIFSDINNRDIDDRL